MIAADHWIRQGDTLPIFSCRLLDNANPPAGYNLTGCTVALVVRPSDPSRPAASLTGTVDATATGDVSRAWTTADTAEAGDYLMHWRVVGPSGTMTFPNDRFFSLHVEPKL